MQNNNVKQQLFGNKNNGFDTVIIDKNDKFYQHLMVDQLLLQPNL